MKKKILLLIVSFLVLGAAISVFAENAISPIEELKPPPRCQTLWWYDNSHQYCQKKQFCGLYMYEGLQTFKTKAECETDLKSKFDPACIQSALEKRENAIIAAYDKKTAAIKVALEQRKTALKEAWGKPTVRERVLARAAAWKAFKTAQYKANKTYKTEIKAAWQQFYKDRKACKTVTEKNDEPNLIDQNL